MRSFKFVGRRCVGYFPAQFSAVKNTDQGSGLIGKDKLLPNASIKRKRKA
jgi:hypothetical protein